MSHVLERCGAQARNLHSLSKSQQELLRDVGNGWDSPLELPDRYLRSDAAKQFSSSLREALNGETAKDCCLACVHGMERILPLWHSALEEQNLLIQHLLVVRHPLAVVEQFRNIEGWDRDHALLVWLQSTLAMEKHSRNCSRVIVDGEQLSWDLDATLNLIESTLQLTLPERHHKSLIELDKETMEQTNSNEIKIKYTDTKKSSGSLLLKMSLQLHDWLLAESKNEERQRHLPDTIRQQLKLAEELMGRTISDICMKNKSLKQKLHSLEARRSVRFSNWLRRQQNEAA